MKTLSQLKKGDYIYFDYLGPQPVMYRGIVLENEGDHIVFKRVEFRWHGRLERALRHRYPYKLLEQKQWIYGGYLSFWKRFFAFYL